MPIQIFANTDFYKTDSIRLQWSNFILLKNNTRETIQYKLVLTAHEVVLSNINENNRALLFNLQNYIISFSLSFFTVHSFKTNKTCRHMHTCRRNLVGGPVNQPSLSAEQRGAVADFQTFAEVD